MASVFAGTLDFFNQIGVYDVVLPFLLVFTIVFAIMEKSKIFGTIKVDSTDYTRKNLNAMAAFVIAFFVVGSAQLVSIINKAVANVVILLVLCIMFLLVGGSFNKDEEYYLKGGWNKLFMVLVFIGIVLIFLDAAGWLQSGWLFLMQQWNSVAVSSLIFILLMIGFIYFITQDPKTKQPSGNGNGNGGH